MIIRKNAVSKRRFHAEYPVFKAEHGEDASFANAFSERLMSLLSEKARSMPGASFSLECVIKRDGDVDEINLKLRGTERGRRVISRELRVGFLEGLIKEFEIIR